MGRKRWWKASLELLLLCFLSRLVLGDGEVGCLFSKNVCRNGLETCYDDWAFGRCVRAFGELDDEDTHRYDLDTEELESLRRELETLVLAGYTWMHPYTQCVIQSSLYALRFRLRRDHEICQKLTNVEDRDFEEYSETDDRTRDSQPLAIVNFTPIRGHGYGDFANENYYPPPVSSTKQRNNDNRKEAQSKDSPKDYVYGLSSFPAEDPSAISKFSDSKNYQVEEEGNIDRAEMEMSNIPRFIDENSKNFRELSRRLLTARDEKPIYRLRRQPNSMKNRNDELSERGSFLLDKNLWKLAINNDSARRDEDFGRIAFLRDPPTSNDDENDERSRDRQLDEDNREDNNENENQEAISRLEDSLERLTNRRKSGLYTEGGLIQPIDLDDVIGQELADGDFDDDLNTLLWTRNLAAFQRPERVDVKKPGPLYSTNNYAFKTRSPPAPISIDEADKAEAKDSDDASEVVRAPLVKKGTTNVIYNGKTYENVDLDYVYIQFSDEFKKWSEGKKIVEEIGKLLEMSPDAFTNIRVGRAEVTFKVLSDIPNDAIDVSRKIERIREELQKVTGKEIIRAGIGDKVKLPPTFEVEVTRKPLSTGVFGVIVAAGGAAVAAAAVVILLIARKHAKSRAKLAGLTTPDPEASKDYQDLCRARMQAKQPSDKPESPKIVGLSRESESQRSSTSSWGEEAAALTNMDISTGHMVLTYMEDHLKNKDRLDQEWAGICAYEADPASVARATEKFNADRNRPGSSLPYDHSRVVLNDLSNSNNSDYINASMITDHDPRNPAYIATQGPLSQTSADFWQLVWEQGSVVIVMLTRLTEEGRAMCHRYWPEEGSELYHIYEVHLVSEHIWCDDYLVRSFYLKNLRTGETRTVTQFHFLSWPEHGVPQSTKALLEFRRKVNKSYRGRSCPIVVHCSDGAGRTGTYCLIDMVLNRMAKGAKEIDIAAALEHIRDQRPGMVSTKQQFEFVLVAVAEEVHAILKAMPVQTVAEKSTTAIAASTSATQSSSSGSEQ